MGDSRKIRAYGDGMTQTISPHHEADRTDRKQTIADRLNWLRAAVLGANDGIISIAAIVMGVAGATSDNKTVALAGIAALVAGALSMSVGEYVSVAAQRDAERDALGVDKTEQVSPIEAAIASLLAFTAGGILPLLALLSSSPVTRIWLTGAIVVVALGLTGWTSAKLGDARTKPAIFRNIAGGVVAMGITYLVGSLVGVAL